MGHHLLIDGGQSGCRVVCVVDGERVGSVEAAGLSRHDSDWTVGLLEILRRAFADLRPHFFGAADAVVAGLTGFDDSPETAHRISSGVRALVRAERVIVTNDAVTSYLGAVGFEPGAVVAAGTGIIALAGDGRGNFARADGWGYALGDDGGGYYVGRRGLASALRAHDGRGGSADLLRRVRTTYGAPEDLKRLVYAANNPAAEVARFAREVAQAAREGDPVARGIWADAGREAALSVAATLGRIFAQGTPVTVSWTGNLFGAGEIMLKPFKRHLAEGWPRAQPSAPKGTALRGVELLAASGPPSMFDSLIHAHER